MNDFLEEIAEKHFPDHVFIEGAAHPTGQPNDYDGFLLKNSEIEEHSASIKNTKLLGEHNHDMEIGQVVGGRVDSDGNLRTLTMIHKDEAEIIDDIRTGKKTGFSLGIEHIIEKTPTDMKVVGRNIQELSVVATPDLEGTKIKYIQPTAEERTLKKEIVKQIKENEKLKEELSLTQGIYTHFFNLYINIIILTFFFVFHKFI
jgi:hypothetical protein